MLTSGQVLTTLLLCAFLGGLGQIIRAVVGLKNAANPAKPDQPSAFDGNYLSISLMIGAAAGAVAGLLLGLNNLDSIDTSNLKNLLGIIAAGYAGADFIENAFAKLIPDVPVPGAGNKAGAQMPAE